MARNSARGRPRRSRPPAAAPPPLRGGWVREEDGWTVRSISGSAAGKTYVCPGCHQDIPPGTPHVVVWPAEEGEGDASPAAERSRDAGGGSPERRHWHTGCWGRRRR